MTVERRLHQCEPGNRCKDCAGIEQRLAREGKLSDDAYVAAQEADRATWTEQDRLDVALAHPPAVYDWRLPPFTMTGHLGACGRYRCAICDKALADLASRLIREMMAEDAAA